MKDLWQIFCDEHFVTKVYDGYVMATIGDENYVTDTLDENCETYIGDGHCVTDSVWRTLVMNILWRAILRRSYDNSCDR